MSEAPPDPHELEISVFGPGNGECIVVHVGGGEWIVVDSCINRATKQPIAIDYLTSLGVDVSSQIRLVVATHWHDDHIRGLAEVLRSSVKAKFVNSAAYPLRDLLRITGLGSAMASQSSATKEFEEIVAVLCERKERGESREAVGPVNALANKRIFSSRSHSRSVAAEVIALSPSDGAFNRGAAELYNALTSTKSGQRPSLRGPNQLCVVLWVKVGAVCALLGADLEHVPGSTEGWEGIISSAERPEGLARFFKVPHHGSQNADCNSCWTSLLAKTPLSMLTAYSASLLPRPTDISRLCARSSTVFLTSDPLRHGLPRRENAVEKTLREIAVKRRALSGPMGHIRLRCDARSPTAEALITLRNGAYHACV